MANNKASSLINFHISLNLLISHLIPMKNSKTKVTIVGKALFYFNVEGWNCARIRVHGYFPRILQNRRNPKKP
jgi:hypothetical protein